MNIDLKKRMKNKFFWVAIGSAVVLILQTFGLDISKIPVVGNYEEVINTIFAVLTALGVAVDTSTPGVGDSDGVR
jgi:phi LC3 family holin